MFGLRTSAQLAEGGLVVCGEYISNTLDTLGLSMRLPKLLCTAAVAAGMAVSVIAAAPAVMTDDAGSVTVVDEEPAPEPEPELEPPVELYGSCDDAPGVTIVKSGATVATPVDTPVGAPVVGGVENGDAGTYRLSLEGSEIGTRGSLRLTLSWETMAIADYDMDVNGTSYVSTDSNNEVATLNLGHCQDADVEYYGFIGNPTDTLTMTVRG
jgi:hypothetical protein